MTLDEILSNIRAGKEAPLYVCVGEEFLTREAARAIRAALVPNESTGHQTSMSASQDKSSALTAEAILAELGTMSLFGGRQVVTALDPEFLVPRKGAREDDAEDALLALVEELDPAQAVLIVVAAELPAKSRWGKLAKKSGSLFEANPPAKLKELDLSEFAREALAGKDVRLGPGALEELKTRVGANYRLLRSELEKLALNAERGLISVADVRALVSHAHAGDPFGLNDAVQSRDFRRASQVLREALETGAEPLMLLGALAGLLRRLIVARGYLGAGAAPSNYQAFQGQLYKRMEADARALGAKPQHPYAAFLALQGAARFRAQELLDGLSTCASVDLALKLGSGPPVLERLIWQLCGEAPVADLGYGQRRELER